MKIEKGGIKYLNKFTKGLLIIALGLVFILFNTDFWLIKNNYLPDFIGYLFLIFGLKMIKEYHLYYEKCRKISFMMVFISLLYGPGYTILFPNIYYLFVTGQVISFEQLDVLYNAVPMITILISIIKSTAMILVIFYLINAIKIVFRPACEDIVSFARFGVWFFSIAVFLTLSCQLGLIITMMVAKNEKIFFTLTSLNTYGHLFYLFSGLTTIIIVLWASKLATIYQDQFVTPVSNQSIGHPNDANNPIDGKTDKEID